MLLKNLHLILQIIKCVFAPLALRSLCYLYMNKICLQAAVSSLKQEYKENMTLKEAQELAIVVLSKTLDMTKLTSDKGKYIYLYFFNSI